MSGGQLRRNFNSSESLGQLKFRSSSKLGADGKRSSGGKKKAKRSPQKINRIKHDAHSFPIGTQNSPNLGKLRRSSDPSGSKLEPLLSQKKTEFFLDTPMSKLSRSRLPSVGKRNKMLRITGVFSKSMDSPIRSEYIVPTPAPPEEAVYRFSPYDLAFMFGPYKCISYKYREKVNVDNFRQALGRTVNILPMVAGRIAIRDCQVEKTEADLVLQEAFSEYGDVEFDSKNEVCSVIDFEKPGRYGLLFERIEVDYSVFQKIDQSTFYPSMKSLYPTKAPLVKIRLTTGIDGSVLCFNFAPILGDWFAFNQFLTVLGREISMPLFRSGPMPVLWPPLYLDRTPEVNNFQQNRAKLTNQVMDTSFKKSFGKKKTDVMVGQLQISYEMITNLSNEFNAACAEVQMSQSTQDGLRREALEKEALPVISHYEVLCAIGLLLWNKVRGNKTEKMKGKFCISTRGNPKVLNLKQGYFGNAEAFSSFTVDQSKRYKLRGEYKTLNDELFNCMVQVLRSSILALRQTRKLESLFLEYDLRYSMDPEYKPLLKKKLCKDNRYKKLYLDDKEPEVPIFVEVAQNATRRFYDLMFIPKKTAAQVDVNISSFTRNSVLFCEVDHRSTSIRILCDAQMADKWEESVIDLDLGTLPTKVQHQSTDHLEV